MFDNRKWLLPIFLIFCATFARLIPHAPNFTPVLSIALFAGARLEKRSWAFFVPILAMILSDAIIGFHSLIPIVYLNLLAIVALGLSFRKRVNSVSVIALSIFSSLLFFITSNFAVWVFSPMYSKNAAGLIACFVAAIPFFTNTLASTVVYSIALFGMQSMCLKIKSEKLVF